MRIGKLNAILRKAHNDRSAVHTEHRQELESQLMRNFRAEQSRRWITMLQPHSAKARAVLTGIVVATLGFVACEMPTETEHEFGQRVSVESNVQQEPENKWEFEFAFGENEINHLRELPGVEDVSFGRSVENGKLHQEFVFWGDDVDQDEVLHRVQEVAGDAKVEVVKMSHVVKESWVSKLGRELFHLNLDDGLSDEEIKAQILEQLKEQGIEGWEVTELPTDGSHRAFFIEGTSEDTEGEASITVDLTEDAEF